MLARGLAQQHYLLALIRDLDQTVVVAIHDLTLTERYADHVAVLAGDACSPRVHHTTCSPVAR